MTNAVLKNNRICNQIIFYTLQEGSPKVIYKVHDGHDKFLKVFRLLSPQIMTASYHRTYKDTLKHEKFTNKLMNQGKTFIISTYGNTTKTATIYVLVSPENNVTITKVGISKRRKNMPEYLKQVINTFQNIYFEINNEQVRLQYLISTQTEKYDMKTVVNAKQFHNMLIKKKIFVDMQESNKIFDNFEITPRPVGVLSNVKKNKTK